MVKDSIKLIKFVGQPFVLEILNALKKPKRFTELKDVCKNERTLSKKISLLRENGMVDVVSILVKNKYENHYRLTTKGEEFLKKIKSI